MLFDQSQELADFAAEVLQTVHDKLTLGIQSASNSDLAGSVTVQAMQNLLSEIDTNLEAARRSVEGFAHKTWVDGYQLQFSFVGQQIAGFEASFSSGIEPDALERIAKLKPKITGNLIKAVLDGPLNNLSDSLADVKEPIRRMLATNILTGSSYQDLITEINGLGIDKGPFVTVEARARAIAITETTNVYNYARYDALEAANRTLAPGQKLQLQWVSIIDRKTSARCRSLNRQVREQGQNFEAGDGWRGKMPAAHPHCRSEVVPFREEWTGIFDALERELQTQVKSK